ncbi:hypothetical protein REPUB_Repub05bG0082900 [Reevesia pubescens]
MEEFIDEAKKDSFIGITIRRYSGNEVIKTFNKAEDFDRNKGEGDGMFMEVGKECEVSNVMGDKDLLLVDVIEEGWIDNIADKGPKIFVFHNPNGSEEGLEVNRWDGNMILNNKG